MPSPSAITPEAHQVSLKLAKLDERYSQLLAAIETIRAENKAISQSLSQLVVLQERNLATQEKVRGISHDIRDIYGRINDMASELAEVKPMKRWTFTALFGLVASWLILLIKAAAKDL